MGTSHTETGSLLAWTGRDWAGPGRAPSQGGAWVLGLSGPRAGNRREPSHVQLRGRGRGCRLSSDPEWFGSCFGPLWRLGGSPWSPGNSTAHGSSVSTRGSLVSRTHIHTAYRRPPPHPDTQGRSLLFQTHRHFPEEKGRDIFVSFAGGAAKKVARVRFCAGAGGHTLRAY